MVRGGMGCHDGRKVNMPISDMSQATPCGNVAAQVFPTSLGNFGIKPKNVQKKCGDQTKGIIFSWVPQNYPSFLTGASF